MTQSESVWCWKLGLASFLAISSAFACCGNYSLAQLIPDDTLGAESSVVTNVVINDLPEYQIQGGAIRGANLFHSFQEFNVGEGRGAYFTNPSGIENILSRVTGANRSEILGKLGVLGSANLFLINPNGIIFGPNASLDIRGSFLASTASSLNFADGFQFSSTAPQTIPLLTVSVPIGLQFGATAGSILNQSRATNSGLIVGLQVEPGKTLALVGGEVTLEGGYLTAAEGRIELGSIADSSSVSLTSTNQGLLLGYEEIRNFQDIQLSRNALVSASGEGGNVQVQGRHVILTDSQILATNQGVEPGGNLTLTASESVELIGNSSGLFSSTSAVGDAGYITINTARLLIRDGAVVSTESAGVSDVFGQFTPATGRGGDLVVNASDSVELRNGFVYSGTQGIGDAGDITINTGRLLVQDGGQISAFTVGQGNAGDILVNASDSINLFGASFFGSSGLFTDTFGDGGQGGNITVNTSTFRVADGAILNAHTTAQGKGGNVTVNTNSFEAVNGGQVLTTTSGSGLVGNITINAIDTVTLSGSGPTFDQRITQFSVVDNDSSSSGLFANTAQGSTGDGGDVIIKTKQLDVTDEAVVTVSSQGTGDAGNLQIEARSIRLDEQGKLTATSVSGKGGGNIRLQGLDLLVLRHDSEISTNAGGEGTGGNIEINTDILVALENSDITANAVEGRGGNIQITTQGLFLSPDSDITASSERGIDGIVEINRPDVDPRRGIVNLPEAVVDVSRLVAQGCSADERQEQSEFVIKGSGGLPPNPSGALSGDAIEVDLVTLNPENQNRSHPAISANPTRPISTQIVEAQGWVISPNGNVVLTATAPTVTPHNFWRTSAECRALQPTGSRRNSAM